MHSSATPMRRQRHDWLADLRPSSAFPRRARCFSESALERAGKNASVLEARGPRDFGDAEFRRAEELQSSAESAFHQFRVRRLAVHRVERAHEMRGRIVRQPRKSENAKIEIRAAREVADHPLQSKKYAATLRERTARAAFDQRIESRLEIEQARSETQRCSDGRGIARCRASGFAREMHGAATNRAIHFIGRRQQDGPRNRHVQRTRKQLLPDCGGRREGDPKRIRRADRLQQMSSLADKQLIRIQRSCVFAFDQPHLPA